MDLFPYIKHFFETPLSSFMSKTSVSDMRKHRFMLTRILAIEYPSLANYFNTSMVDDVAFTLVAKSYLADYKVTPPFVRTPSGKKKTKKEITLDAGDIKLLCTHFQCKKEDAEDYLTRYPDKAKEDLKNIKPLYS